MEFTKVESEKRKVIYNKIISIFIAITRPIIDSRRLNRQRSIDDKRTIVIPGTNIVFIELKWIIVNKI